MAVKTPRREGQVRVELGGQEYLFNTSGKETIYVGRRFYTNDAIKISVKGSFPGKARFENYIYEKNYLYDIE